MAYITNADVAKFLNITLTSDGQALIDDVIAAVEKFAETFCNRVWSTGASADITEYFDGGTDVFFVKNPEINTIQSITIDGSTYNLADSYNYGSYIRLSDIVGSGYRNVVIVYRTKSTSVPADLKHALVRWASEIFKSQDDAGKTIKSVSAGIVSIQYDVQDGIPKYVEKVLNKYRLSAGF